MKKLFAIILAIAMALSATACAKPDSRGENGGDRPNTEHTAPTGEPTEEELEQLQDYADSLAILNDWVNGEIETVYYIDEETGEKRRSDLDFGPDYASTVLEHHYNVIQNATAVDKWAGTEWTSDPAVNWDRQEVLDAFTIVEDVALYETVKYLDHLDGVKDESVAVRYHYNQLLQLSSVHFLTTPNAWRGFAPFELVKSHPEQLFPGNRILVAEYDDSDQITAVRTENNSGGVINKSTVTYNQDSTFAAFTNVTAKGETTTATYVYDDQLRVVEIQVTGQEQRVYSYEYDAKGNLITAKEVCNIPNNLTEHLEIVTEVYSYSKDGKLESCERTEGSYFGGELSYETKDVYTYECDDQGRPVKATVVPGDKMNVKAGEVMHGGEADYAKAEHTLVYGDYYIYGGK